MTLQERLERYLGQTPQIHPTAYIAPGSTVLGDVTIGEQSSVWPSAVLRGDINAIRIGDFTNIQDGAILHLADDYPTILGNHVTVGHAAVVHACTVEDEVLIGMHATILDGAVIGKGSIIGAHTLVKAGMQVPPGSLVLGIPGRIQRQLTQEEQAGNIALAKKYLQVSAAHRAIC